MQWKSNIQAIEKHSQSYNTPPTLATQLFNEQAAYIILLILLMTNTPNFLLLKHILNQGIHKMLQNFVDH